jgi:glycosyltransferase involved in cell wall biosynthesis
MSQNSLDIRVLDTNMKSVKYEDLPLVSIIIPLHNNARFIEKCLESVKEETYPKIEVLVLDDGSTDESFHVAEHWCSKKKNNLWNVILKRQANRGITRTLNKLVRMASGEYIAILASDDYLLKGGIEARVKYLQNNPQLLAVFGDCLVVDEDNDIIYKSGITEIYPSSARINALKNKNLIALELALRWSVPGPVFLMRKCTCDIAGYYDESLTVEDRDFYLRLLTMEALGFVDYKVACYRWHDRNDTKNPVGDYMRDESWKIASLKASREAKGIFRIALIFDYKRKNNIGWRKAMKNRGVMGMINSIFITIIWKILHKYQDIRIWVSAVES